MSDSSPLLRRRVLALVTGLIVTAGVSCGGGNGNGGDGSGGMIQPPPPTVSANIVSIQNNIFTPKCALSGCHTGPTPQPLQGPGLRLSYDPASPVSTQLINVTSTQDPNFRRVDPGNSRDSYLYMKLIGDPRIAIPVPGSCSLTTGTACSVDADCPAGEACDSVGGQMPKNNPLLNGTELAAVANWIDGGALASPGNPGY